MIVPTVKTDKYELYLGNCLAILDDLFYSNINAVITDPPYDCDEHTINSIVFGLDYSGNTILFCKPENQFLEADEYLFWSKTPSTKNYSKNCGRFVEMILVLRRGNTFNQLHWSQMTGIYDDRLIMPPIHPYEKPITLIERLIRIYTNPGDIIFDPFMGSGTTGAAAVRLNRKFIGIEIESKYFEIAEKRIRESAMQELLFKI